MSADKVLTAIGQYGEECEFAGDIFSAQYQSFPAAARIPVAYKRSPNPGLVFVCVGAR